jgi:nitrogen fixation protein NifU and related proteins
MSGGAEGARLGALYQAIVLEHSRTPRRFGPLPRATHRAQRDNPLCGDAVTVALAITRTLEGARIDDVRFEGAGCAIAMAAASMMAEAIAGRPRSEAAALAGHFCRFVAGEVEAGAIGDLAAFAGVARFPVRVACARLPWLALLDALGLDPPARTNP